MNYITVREAAANWHVAERSVQNYCINEKIPGVKRIGGQWFIPFDAQMPQDGRRRTAKVSRSNDNYKFPVFIYTRFYRDSNELTQEEQNLLQAQLLHFEGNHVQSMALCNNLLKSDISPYLEAGTYLMLGIDAFIMGLVTQYEDAVLNLEKLTDAEHVHKEDFRLMTGSLKYYINCNSQNILKIQPSELSPDAVWYYQALLLSVSAISGDIIPIYVQKLCESECSFFKKEGMIPMLYYILCALGILNDCVRTQDEKDMFLEAGVKLAVENNWVHNLHRFYNFSPERLVKCISSYGNGYYRQLISAHKTSLNNWNIIHIKETGLDFVGIFTPKQFELLLLISYGYTNKEIALCTGLSEDTLRKNINRLMEISRTGNKVQLKKYAKEFFNKTV